MPAKSSTPKNTSTNFSTLLQEAKDRIAKMEATVCPMVPVAHLISNQRIRKETSFELIKQLALSIKEAGLIHPVVVRRHPKRVERFEIIDGEMRWRAHKYLGEQQIKVQLIEGSDEQIARISLGLKRTTIRVSDFELARLAIQMKSDPNELERTCRMCGLPAGGLDYLFAFENLPSFMIEQLERTPRLLSATAAKQISTQLKVDEQATMSAIKRHWEDLVNSITDDAQFAALVSLSLRNNSRDQPEESNLWAGW